MGLLGWIIYLLLGLFYFSIITFINSKYSITKVQKMIFSIILLMITAGIGFNYAFKYIDNIFLSFVFLMIFDIIYVSYFLEKDFFDKEEKNIYYYLVLILVGFFINQEFFNDVSSVFLTGSDLRLILWSFVIIFMYNFCKEKEIINNKNVDKEKGMSVDSILTNYAKLKYQYFDYCDMEDKTLSNVLYAIMIYRSSKRSKFLRNYDYFMFRLNGKTSKLSIMQVNTNRYITDIEGINIVKEDINEIVTANKLVKGKTKKELDYLGIIDSYCEEDSLYVKNIFEIIKKL